MEVIWKLINTCITPIITYGSEAWKTTKAEEQEINKILDNIIKRTLKLPTSTPREVLYMETGLMDICAITQKTDLPKHTDPSTLVTQQFKQ